jgi:hypothetical protein
MPAAFHAYLRCPSPCSTSTYPKGTPSVAHDPAFGRVPGLASVCIEIPRHQELSSSTSTEANPSSGMDIPDALRGRPVIPSCIQNRAQRRAGDLSPVSHRRVDPLASYADVSQRSAFKMDDPAFGRVPRAAARSLPQTYLNYPGSRRNFDGYRGSRCLQYGGVPRVRRSSAG